MTLRAPRSRRRPYRGLRSACCARDRLRVGDGVTHGGGQAAFVVQVDVVDLASCDGDDVFGLRNGARQPRAVDLDDQHLVLDVKREAPTFGTLTEPAGVKTRRNILESELFVRRRLVRREAHDGTLPRATACLHLLFDCHTLRTTESYPLPTRVKHAGQLFSCGVVLMIASYVTACTSHPTDTPPPTIVPAQAAVSPPVTQPPAGVIRPMTGHATSALFDAATESLAVLGPGAGDQSAITAMPAKGQARTVSLA